MKDQKPTYQKPSYTFSRRNFLGGSAIVGAGLFVAGALAGANFGLFKIGAEDAYAATLEPPQKPRPPHERGEGPLHPPHKPRGTVLKEISRDGVLTRLAIMSDLHLCTYDNAAADKLTVALDSYGWVAPGIDAFFMLGDITLNGLTEELDAFASHTSECLRAIYTDVPPMHLIMGNHDFWEGNQKSFENAFAYHADSSLFAAKQNTVAMVPGATIIKLNGHGSYETDVMNYVGASEFLIESLDEAAKNRPDDAILVMSHEPPLGMKMPDDFECGNYGQESGYNMIELMQQYPQLRMFSGHIHNNLDKKHSINTDLGFTSVHTSTVGSCYFYKGFLEDDREIGSQGLILDIMEDGKLKLYLLDFDTQEQLGEAVEI